MLAIPLSTEGAIGRLQFGQLPHELAMASGDRSIATGTKIIAQPVRQDGSQPRSKRPLMQPLELGYLAEDDQQQVLGEVVDIVSCYASSDHPGAE